MHISSQPTMWMEFKLFEMYLIYQQVWSLFWYHFKLLCFHIRCLCFHIKCFCFHIRSFMFPYKVLMFSYKVIMFPYKMFMFSNTSWSSIIYLKLVMSSTQCLQFRVHQPTHASKGCIIISIPGYFLQAFLQTYKTLQYLRFDSL